MAIADLTQAVEGIGELFLGTANGPFVLLLKANNRDAFLAHSREQRRHRVQIGWSRRHSAAEWRVTPVDALQPYELKFALPELMAQWIAEQGQSLSRASRAAKAEFLSRITIYRVDEVEGDELFQLEYQKPPREG